VASPKGWQVMIPAPALLDASTAAVAIAINVLLI
jgi:hypothetical protein